MPTKRSGYNLGALNIFFEENGDGYVMLEVPFLMCREEWFYGEQNVKKLV